MYIQKTIENKISAEEEKLEVNSRPSVKVSIERVNILTNLYLKRSYLGLFCKYSYIFYGDNYIVCIVHIMYLEN